jgi:Concanavalin A-like lectin/glucanases superfamily
MRAFPALTLLVLTSCAQLLGLEEGKKRVPDGAAQGGFAAGGAGGLGGEGGAAADCGTYCAVVMSDAPVAYWRLDESKGPTASDHLGDLDGSYDVSTLINFGNEGIADQGSSVGLLGGFVTVGDSSALDFSGLKDFTIEVWIQATASTTGVVHLASKYSMQQGGYALVLSQGRPIFWRCSPTLCQSVDAIGVITVNQWHHVVGTFDGVSNRVFFDAVLAQAPTTVPLPDTPLSLLFGVDQEATGEFAGRIDEVVVYDHALSTTRVEAHHDAASLRSL